MVHRAEWMAEGSYGIMVHWFPAPSGKTPEEMTADFNRMVDGFDVDYFIKQFEATKADWLIFTVGQNTGYFNSPNAWLDQRAPGFTPKRDLMLEIAKRVKKLNKRFIIYISGQAPNRPDPRAPFTLPIVQKAFGWNIVDPGAFGSIDPKADIGPFVNNYLEFVKAYSLKFGKLCDGWWYDGCYPGYCKGNWDWSRWADASRAGNPNGAVAFSDGSFAVGKTTPVSPLQDYLSGETHSINKGMVRLETLMGEDLYLDDNGDLLMPTRPTPPKYYMPTSQYVDGVQWQALVPVDSTFNIPAKFCHYPAELLIKFVLDCRKVKGAVTYNLPIGLDGHIPEATMAKMSQVGKAVER